MAGSGRVHLKSDQTVSDISNSGKNLNFFFVICFFSCIDFTRCFLVLLSLTEQTFGSFLPKVVLQSYFHVSVEQPSSGHPTVSDLAIPKSEFSYFINVFCR